MTNIRVDPSHLRDVAQQLDAIVDRVRTLGNEANQITLNTPSYDGQFGPKARALGMEAEARLVAQARRLSSLSEDLVVRAAAFEAVDRETLTAFDQLTEVLQSWMDQASLVLSPLVRLANFPWERINRYLRLGFLIEDPGDGEEEDEDEEEDEKERVNCGCKRNIQREASYFFVQLIACPIGQIWGASPYPLEGFWPQYFTGVSSEKSL